MYLFEFLLQILIPSLFAAWIGWLTATGSKYLMTCLDFGGIWWKVKYKAALRASSKVGLTKLLENNLQAAMSAKYSEQVKVMKSAYEDIAAKHLPFNRWICPFCMAGFISVFVLIISVVSLFILGFSPLSIIAFSISYPILVYHFV